MMAETIYNLDQDLREAQAMADGLVPYVYEEQLYGKVGSGGMFSSSKIPSLTVGALLMRLRRLHALEDQMTEAQRATLAQIDQQHESVRKEWTLHYNNKLTQEALSRLKLIRQYFDECREEPRACANAYLPEALRRTIVQEIADAMKRNDTPSEEIERTIRSTDSGLRRYAQPSEFIWAKELQPIYPQSTFWWLYARPPVPGSTTRG
jgi:hypothetical protein